MPLTRFSSPFRSLANAAPGCQGGLHRNCPSEASYSPANCPPFQLWRRRKTEGASRSFPVGIGTELRHTESEAYLVRGCAGFGLPVSATFDLAIIC